MAGKIIMWIVSFGCALTFYSIGIYAQRRKKPMWFWSGTEVDAAEITDVQQYNKENGIMWKIYALCFFAAGFAEIWNSKVSTLILISISLLGPVFLIYVYNKIYKKYKVK